MREHAFKPEVFDQTNPEEMIELSVTHMDGLDPNETFDSAKLLALCQK